MTLKNYTLKVKKQEYWQEIHDLLCEPSSCEHIPDREVSCTDEKEHSPTRGTFSLHGSEVEELKKHPYIDWVELCPTCNPDSYPNPVPATKRFKKDVKVYRTLDSTPATNPTISELNRTNWGIARVGITTFGEFWGTDVASIDPKYSDFSYSLSGKNVDIVMQDSGILQYHPEFLDANGRSRVRDVILDGPYYIDPEYFDSNNLTYTKSDGRVGIATTAAENWWEDGSKRSIQFSSIGTISVSVDYTVNRALGDSLDGTNNITDSHGTACASLAAGKNFGLAFESNIWNMAAVSDNTLMGIETSLDAIKIFHKYKPINVETGLKNPTVVNGSWTYIAGQYKNVVETVDYQFRGTTGTFQSNTLTVDQVTAMRNGLTYDFTDSSYKWGTSSRSSSVLEAGNEMMSAGVIFIAGAGNFNQRIGIGSDDPDRLNYMTDTLFNFEDPRFPSGTVPCNHKQWMEPLAFGFDSEKDFYPVICVGGIDDYVLFGGVERQTSYSNNGPGIDVWAPADDILAATVSGLNEHYQRYDDDRFYDRYFNGTSAATPVTTGLIALYLQSNPKATSRDVKNWIKRRASKLLSSDLYYDQYTDDTQTTYWTGKYNLRGAESRILYNPYANDQQFELSSTENIIAEEPQLEIKFPPNYWIKWGDINDGVIRKVKYLDKNNIYFCGRYFSRDSGFIGKTNESGEYLWIKEISAPGFTDLLTIDFDSSGNIYVAGGSYFSDTLSYFIIAKYDSLGNVIWQKTLGNSVSGGLDALKVSNSGYIYVSGFTTGSGEGQGDILVMKLDQSANIIWQRTLGSFDLDFGRDLALDSSENLIISASNSDNMIIVKYSSSGSLQWQRNYGQSISPETLESLEYGDSIAIDSNNNIYIAGTIYAESFLFGRGFYIPFGVILKYNPSGILQWQKSVSSGFTDIFTLYGIVIDSNDNLYITGSSEAYLQSSNGVLIAKLNTSGTRQWERVLYKNVPTSQYGMVSYGYGIDIDEDGDLYITGYTTYNKSGVYNKYYPLSLKVPSDGSLVGYYGPYVYKTRSSTFSNIVYPEIAGSFVDSPCNFTLVDSNFTVSSVSESTFNNLVEIDKNSESLTITLQ